MSQKYFDRIGLGDEPEKLVSEFANAFNLGEVTDYKVMEVGYEDCNVHLTTTLGNYAIKLFSAVRSDTDVSEYVNIITHALDAGVSHPRLYESRGDFIHKATSGARGIAMDYIHGASYFDMHRAPTESETELIMRQAVKVHKIDLPKRELYDSWAIPFIDDMYERVKKYLPRQGDEFVQEAMRRYHALDSSRLSTSFVHGDFTKACAAE